MGLLVFVVAFGAYAWTASPVAGWLDSAEFVAASASLGVSHSPGHPIATFVGYAARLVPVGDVVLRINLVAALAGAGAAAALYHATAALLARLTPGVQARARAVLAAAAALGFAFTWAAWFQAVRAEVYALEALLLFLALGWLIRWDARGERRALLAAGLAVGLALANHHFVTILFFAPAAAVALARRPGARLAGMTALLGVLGLAAFLYLPTRAARDPEVNWGDPQTADRFAWTVSARAFQKSLEPEQAESRAVEAGQVTAALVDQASPTAFLAALVGAYLLLRRRETRRLGLLLGGVLLTVAAGRAALGFDDDNPDAFGYLLPALGVLFVLAAAAVAVIVQSLPTGDTLARRLTPVAVCLATLALPLWQLTAHAHAASLRGANASERYARAALDDLPPRTLLVTSYYETAFQLWALQAVEVDRPDVTLLDRSFLTYPGFAPAARRREPALAALVDAPLRTGRPSPLAALTEVAATRPVFLEPHIKDLDDDAVLPYLLPLGLAARFTTPPASAGQRELAERRDLLQARHLEEALARAAPTERTGAQRVLLWSSFLRARFYCAGRRVAAAAASLATLARLAPGDPWVDDLRAGCGRE